MRPGWPCGVLAIAPASTARMAAMRARQAAKSTLAAQDAAASNSRNRSGLRRASQRRSEEHTSELQSLMRISYAVFCLKKKTKHNQITSDTMIQPAEKYNKKTCNQQKT